MRFERTDKPGLVEGVITVHYAVTDSLSFVTGAIAVNMNGVFIIGEWPVLKTEDMVLFEETLARARIHYRHFSDGTKEPLSEAEIDRILGPIPPYEG